MRGVCAGMLIRCLFKSLPPFDQAEHSFAPLPCFEGTSQTPPHCLGVVASFNFERCRGRSADRNRARALWRMASRRRGKEAAVLGDVSKGIASERISGLRGSLAGMRDSQ